jgi:hypothetical protein
MNLRPPVIVVSTTIALAVVSWLWLSLWPAV